MMRERASQVVALLVLLLLVAISHCATSAGETLERTATGENARQFSGIYPHLASFNTGAECGTGAVVPWAGRLWWISYSPHMPSGSDDKLYAADTSLDDVPIPTGILRLDGHSMLYVDDDGQRYRLPIGNPIYQAHPEILNQQRTSPEVTTERDLFQCAGTFYELPARNAGGFAKIRPIATHPLFVQDYCSWRGLLVLSGVAVGDNVTNSHIIRSSDGLCAVWLGAVDDLWTLGKPVGRGGPWTQSQVRPGEPSDPYLLTGYDHKVLTLSHDADTPVTFRLEVDISGTGNWHMFHTLDIPPRGKSEFTFPPAFEAYWIRLVASDNCLATAEFVYK